MRRLNSVAFTFLSLACGCPLSAQEVLLDSFAGLGARAMGMGGAYTALSNDFSGLFWNPAGLARIQKKEIYTALSHENFRNQTQFFGTPAADRLSSTRLNAVGATYPYPVYRGSLVFAGGYGRTGSFDSGLKIEGYDTISQFEKSGISEDRGGLGAFVLGGAVDVAPNTSLGLSLQAWRGSDRFRQELTLRDTEDAHGDTIRLYQRFTFTDRYTAWGGRAGLLYLHPSGMRVGVSISSPIIFQVRSELEDEFEDELEGGTESYPPEGFSDRYSLRYPFAFDLGMAWSGRGLTLAGDLQYADLQQVTYRELPDVISPHVESFQNQYRNTFRYHLGAEYRTPQGVLALRAGYYRDPVRYVGGQGQPTVQVEEGRDVLTFGLGTLLEKTVALDLAVAVGGHRQVEGNRQDHIRTVRLFASMGCRF